MKKVLILPLIAALLTGCATDLGNNTTAENRSVIEESSDTYTYDEETATYIELDDSNVTITGTGVNQESENYLTIIDPGTYIVSGNSKNISIAVTATADDIINIVLRSATLISSTGPALSIVESSETNLFIEGENIITVTGENEDEETSAIYSKDDLIILGDGSLIITSEEDAIHANDNCDISDTTIVINAGGDGINVNDVLTISGNDVTITATDDAIKVGNDNEKNAGDVIVDNAKLTLTAGDDGIDATGNVEMTGAIATITTGGGAETSTKHQNNQPMNEAFVEGGFNPNEKGPGETKFPDGMQEPPQAGPNSERDESRQKMPTLSDDKNIPSQPAGDNNESLENSANQFIPQVDEQNVTSAESDSFENDIAEEEETESAAKGIKAEGNITISECMLNIDSSDDGIHSNSDININGDMITISSGDDGIHADGNMVIDGFSITISQSYEGLEAYNLTINSGDINITSSDDGINTANPNANTGMMDTDDSYLTINGGTIVIDSNGDGIDMNGNGEMSNGNVTIYGPTSGADGALDYAEIFNFNGGILLAGGSSRMAQKPSRTSSAMSILEDVNSQTVTIKDSSGAVIAEYSTDKNCENLLISSDALQEGKTYTIETTEGETKEVVVSRD